MQGTMGTFRDKTGADWKVDLDALLIEEVREKHNLDLANLEKDPLLTLRNDPMTLVAVVYILCEDQVKERNLDPKSFAKQLPHVDQMLGAIKDAIVDFFPTGRASHVREVLTKFEEMNAKTDEIALAKMLQILQDKRTTETLSSKADEEIQKALDNLLSTGGSLGRSTTTVDS